MNCAVVLSLTSDLQEKLTLGLFSFLHLRPLELSSAISMLSYYFTNIYYRYLSPIFITDIYQIPIHTNIYQIFPSYNYRYGQHLEAQFCLILHQMESASSIHPVRGGDRGAGDPFSFVRGKVAPVTVFAQ